VVVYFHIYIYMWYPHISLKSDLCAISCGFSGPIGAPKGINSEYTGELIKLLNSDHFCDFALHGHWEDLVYW